MNASFIGGFVAGEGTFGRTGRRFRFAVELGAVDRGSCEALHRFFGVGQVYWYPRRQPHYDDEVTYVVQAVPDLVGVIVPFMDVHLPPSFKQEQYRTWRAALLEFWDTGMKRRRPCTMSGCERPQRGKGLCRQHYYAAGYG